MVELPTYDEDKGDPMIQISCNKCGWKSKPFHPPSETHGGLITLHCGNEDCQEPIGWVAD